MLRGDTVNLMKKFVAPAAIITIAFLGQAFGQAPSQGDPPKPANGVIEGNVSLEGKSAPGIRVFLIPASESFRSSVINAQGISDEQGRFRITGVPEGAYTVVTEAGPYVLPNKGYRGTPGVLVLLRKAEERSTVELELRLGGIITGRVTDADGQPIIGGRVAIQKIIEAEVQPVIGRRPPSQPTRERPRSQILPLSNQSRDTDDRGIYRIYGLSAGKYIVSVKANPVPLPPGLSGDSVLDSSTTYYPGVTNESSAVPVDLEAAGTAGAIDIVIAPPVETHSVAGRVVDSESGRPVPNIRVSYVKAIQTTTEPPNLTQVRTDASGEFRLNGLATGQYLVLTLPDSGNDFYSNPAPIQIISDDLSGVEIPLLKGASVTGVAVLSDNDGGDAGNPFTNTTVSAVLEGNGSLTERLLARSSIDSNGGFRLTGLRPGRIRLMVSSYPANDISLLSIDRNGLDGTRGIDVGAGESISGVRLVLGNGQGSIAGSLKTKNGESLDGAKLNISVNRPNQARRFADVDKSGRFSLVNLPAGDYELEAFVTLPADSGKRPALLTAKQRLTVKAKRTTEIVVVLDTPQR